ncbi:MAG TPA: bifunctional adenosylcobinamide kinase/adenosylcobinamide-phosphate guanylyltransferase [Syntrophomonadaceae bacterium]|nr:bifunctional adenosylcobinamide kinase/adenosylcobinamide-phosphate guanylyltransferase [Syntrophomonadaceae bacterium]
MADVFMVLGGSSSRKSAYAEELTRVLAARHSWPVYYLATGTIWDEEFARRVERHRQRRPSNWQTIEEAYDLAGVLCSRQDHSAVYLVDGIGTWLTNLMFETGEADFYWDGEREKQCQARLQEFIEAGAQIPGAIILVADEAGTDIMPENQQARVFQDLNGRVNQVLAQAAVYLYWVVAGIPLCLKGGAGC